MDKDYLVLKRASTSRSSGEWNDDDYDVLADGAVVGRILKVHAAPVGSPWMWTLAFGQHEDRTPTHGYAESRDAAMAAFAKSWRTRRATSPLSIPLARRATAPPGKCRQFRTEDCDAVLASRCRSAFFS
jgi:hypothetical protein